MISHLKLKQLISKWLKDDILNAPFHPRKLTYSLRECTNYTYWAVSPLSAAHHFEKDIYLYPTYEKDETHENYEQIIGYEIKVGTCMRQYTVIRISDERIDFHKNKNFSYPFTEEILRRLYEKICTTEDNT